MSDQALADLLAEHGRGPDRSFHMPGHKGRALHTPALPWELDITEIPGFDDLHDPDGILAEGMARAAALWGSEEARYLINGSSGGILAALHAALPRGGTLLMARNCHKSAYHALELLDLTPVYLLPEVDAPFGVAGSLAPDTVAAALEEHPEAGALLLVSPTYDGVLSDVAALCRLCHARGIPVIVDEAHGAHLGFAPFPQGAVAAGADLVIQSLHKTLPSLTQTALLHRRGERIDPARLAHSLDIFQSSSPSYPLMASMDGCVRLMEREKERLFPAWMDVLTEFDRRAAELRHLRVLCHGEDRLADHPALWGFDPSKLVISTRGTDLSGPALLARLGEEFHLIPEMAAPSCVTAMTGPGTTGEDLTALAHALLTIDGTLSPDDGTTAFPAPSLPRRVLSAGQALEEEREVLPLAQAGGRVAAEALWAYPPGIPLLVPGEEIPPDFSPLCACYEAAGIPLKHTGGTGAREVAVCREKPMR